MTAEKLSFKSKQILHQFGVHVLTCPTAKTTSIVKDSVRASTRIKTKEEKLQALAHTVSEFEACALKKTALNLVFSDGNPHARVMLVGEAPGADEDRQGKPFVGMSGQLLTKMFACIGLNRDTDLYLTNIIPWRPPGNRQPTLNEIRLCLPFVQNHIAIIQPDLLVLVGGTATKALISDKVGITGLHGKWFDLNLPAKSQPIKTTAIYHPAYLLRSPLRKREVWKDLIHIKKELNLEKQA